MKRTQIAIYPKEGLLTFIDSKKPIYGTRARTVIAILAQALEAKE